MPRFLGLNNRRVRLIGAALAAVLLIAVGYAAGYATPHFTAPGDDSAEAGFARDMTFHHSQAVRMSFLEYDRGDPSTPTGATLHRMAYDMGTSQQYQSGVMETWLQEWGLQPLSDHTAMSWVPDGKSMLQSDGRMPGLASPDEMKRLETVSGKDADVLYCQLMIRHHLGGLHMIRAVLDRTDRAEVVELAENMQRGQQGEVDQLRLLLKDLGGDPV
jgi:uncharacterized protein (DUF305 family)